MGGGAGKTIGRAVPRREFAEPALRRLGNLGMGVREPDLRIDVVELRCLDQSIQYQRLAQPRVLSRRRAMTFLPNQTAQRSFRRVVKGYGVRDATFRLAFLA